MRSEDRVVLNKMSFSVEPGHTIIIMGAAGSGKTVLLKNAIGLICPDSGSVRLLGHDIAHLREQDLYPLRYQVGVLFQESALFDSMTVEENVAYPLLNPPGRKPAHADVLPRVRQALDFVGLSRVVDKYPAEISGGMRRRVGIARAAVTKPRLMLYDSPTAGLDPITANRIMALAIRQRDMADTALLVVTHRRQNGALLAHYRYDSGAAKIVRSDEAQQTTRFMILCERTVVFEGSEAELSSATDPYISKFAWRT